MFPLISALKGFNDSQESKSKAAARWIVVKVSDLNSVCCLKNEILLQHKLIFY